MSFLSQLRAMRAKQKKTVKIAWLGLDRAGKTTLIRQMLEKKFYHSPGRTLGMDVLEQQIGEFKFILWDLGGQISYRQSLWKNYLEGAWGIVYVVDAAEINRFDEAKRELWTYILTAESSDTPSGEKKAPLLVLANKQDLNAVAAGAVARAIKLHKVIDRSYAIFPTSARTGYNLTEAMDWLIKRVTEKVEET